MELLFNNLKAIVITVAIIVTAIEAINLHSAYKTGEIKLFNKTLKRYIIEMIAITGTYATLEDLIEYTKAASETITKALRGYK
jgi:hypothetical protein